LQPLRVDLQATEARFADPAVQADLARVGLRSLATILAREMVPQQNGLFVIPPEGPVHSDFFPSLEYVAQRGFFLNRLAERWTQFREDFSPRANTLFGRYLQQHSFTSDDFKAFAWDFQDHRMPDARLFRSLLHRWQGDATRPVFPIELWAAASDRTPAAELRALRMAPLQEAMLADASTNSLPLRRYSADLMETYRGQRSIFYLPPTTNLESVIERLLQTDTGWQRIYKLHLAEIAWDRGDDARCLELGRSALDPDINRNGPIDFSPDPSAPRAVIYRMAESLWRAGKLAEAWVICREARAGGYLVNAETLFPLLDLTYRRIEAAVTQSQTTPASAAP
jgi:hypothetical protein